MSKEYLFRITGKAISNYAFDCSWCSDCPKWRDDPYSCCKENDQWNHWNSFNVDQYVWASSARIALMRIDPDFCFIEQPRIKQT